MNATIPATDRNVTRGHNQPAAKIELTPEQMKAIAQSRDALITELSSVVEDELNDIIVKVEHAKKDVQAGPFAILSWFRENVEPEILEKFPKPGSEFGDNPDKYKEPYYRDGKLKFKATSFYLKFFLTSFPEGKRIATALSHVALAKDEKANQESVPEYIRGMNDVALESYREDLQAMQNVGVKALRDAMALEKQLIAVNNLPEVGAAPLTDDDDNVMKVSKPIKVWNTKSPEKHWNLYSISGFMQFDPDAAMEKGGTYDALKITAKRERAEDQGNGNGSDKPVAVNTNVTMAARINDIAEYIHNKLMPEGNKNREVYGLFLKDQVNGPDGDDLIYNLNEIKLFVDGVLNIPAVQTRLEKITDKRAAA